ncbi:MAG: hypothetical protein MH204_03550, partial [Fimbriimonadaceae bacterium]|nr:hypothetical protein [Fimbriimonadaceae bacterium]
AKEEKRDEVRLRYLEDNGASLESGIRREAEQLGISVTPEKEAVSDLLGDVFSRVDDRLEGLEEDTEALIRQVEALRLNQDRRFDDLGRLLQRLIPDPMELKRVTEGFPKLQEAVAAGFARNEELHKKTQDLIAAGSPENLTSHLDTIRSGQRRLIEEFSSRFFGRDAWLEAEIMAWLNSAGRPRRLVIAEGGMGKSAVAAETVLRAESLGWIVLHQFFRPDSGGASSRITALQNLVSQAGLHLRVERPFQVPNSEDVLGEALTNRLNELAAGSRRILIVLDGLDEAADVWWNNEQMRPFLQLPPGAKLLATARADAASLPGWLRPWREGLDPVTLPHLDEGGVAEWMELAGDGELAALRPHAGRLAERTQGLPLLLYYVMQSLADAKPEEQNRLLDELDVPGGTEAVLAKYVAGQIERLEEAQTSRRLLQVLAVLSIVKEPISAGDLDEILGAETDPGSAGPVVSRWWQRIQAGRENRYGFTHPRLADAFRASLLLTPDLMDRFLAWVSEPGQAAKGYRLRHARAHLLDELDRRPEA